MDHEIVDRYTHTHPSGDVGSVVVCSCGWRTDVIVPYGGLSRDQQALRSHAEHATDPDFHKRLPANGSHSHSVPRGKA